MHLNIIKAGRDTILAACDENILGKTFKRGKSMRKMTEKSLREAFAGESQAHMKYLIFAEQAEKEGLHDVARLFRAISFAEQVHATNHFKALMELHKTSENLQSAWDGENFEIEEMYPAYNAIATLQNEKML